MHRRCCIMVEKGNYKSLSCSVGTSYSVPTEQKRQIDLLATHIQALTGYFEQHYKTFI